MASARVIHFNNIFRIVPINNSYKNALAICKSPLNVPYNATALNRTYVNWSKLHPPVSITSLGSGKSTRPCIIGDQQAQRNYSSSNEDDQDAEKSKVPILPELMEAPFLVWPSLIKTVKNWIFMNFVLKPYLYKDFDLTEFIAGSKQALEVVSNRLASSDFKGLVGLVSADALVTLKENIDRMSVAQRNEIAVQRDDIYLSFPYEVGIFDGDEEEEEEKYPKQFLEITMVFHSLKGLKSLREQKVDLPLNVGVTPEYRDRITICNYRFIKEVTKGVESEWTVNLLNHIKPADVVDGKI